MITPTSGPSTIGNVDAFLRKVGIPGVVLDDSRYNDDPARVFMIDTQCRLLAHCFAHPRFWSRDSGRNHGKGVRGSFRSRTTPSMQVCVHEVNGDLDYFVEIDFDENSPAVNFFGHAKEVVCHELTGGKTDPAKIAIGLQELLPQLPEMIKPTQADVG